MDNTQSGVIRRKLTRDEFEEVTYGTAYEVVKPEEPIRQGRWYTTYSTIVKDKATGTLYALLEWRGNTEEQEVDWDRDGAQLIEAEPREVMVTQYLYKILGGGVVGG